MDNTDSEEASPANPDKYLCENRQERISILRDILLGNAPRSETVHDCCRVLKEIHDLQHRIKNTPSLCEEAETILFSIAQSLSAMSANLITSLALKSERDIARSTREMEARVRYYRAVLPDCDKETR